MSSPLKLSGAGGKDVVLIASREELATPSKVSLPEPEPTPGLILPDGSINWGCPCLGGMATGPCGQPFRNAFSCFHYSAAEPKGSDCYDKFATMQECMTRYPTLYAREDDDELANAMAEAESSADAKVEAKHHEAKQEAKHHEAKQEAKHHEAKAAGDAPTTDKAKAHAHSAH